MASWQPSEERRTQLKAFAYAYVFNSAYKGTLVKLDLVFTLAIVYSGAT